MDSSAHVTKVSCTCEFHRWHGIDNLYRLTKEVYFPIEDLYGSLVFVYLKQTKRIFFQV